VAHLRSDLDCLWLYILLSSTTTTTATSPCETRRRRLGGNLDSSGHHGASVCDSSISFGAVWRGKDNTWRAPPTFGHGAKRIVSSKSRQISRPGSCETRHRAAYTLFHVRSDDSTAASPTMASSGCLLCAFMDFVVSLFITLILPLPQSACVCFHGSSYGFSARRTRDTQHTEAKTAVGTAQHTSLGLFYQLLGRFKQNCGPGTRSPQTQNTTNYQARRRRSSCGGFGGGGD